MPLFTIASLADEVSKRRLWHFLDSVLVILYHVLREKKPYADLGADYFDQLDAVRIQRHHIQRLEQLGFAVTLTPKGAA